MKDTAEDWKSEYAALRAGLSALIEGKEGAIAYAQLTPLYYKLLRQAGLVHSLFTTNGDGENVQRNWPERLSQQDVWLTQMCAERSIAIGKRCTETFDPHIGALLLGGAMFFLDQALLHVAAALDWSEIIDREYAPSDASFSATWDEDRDDIDDQP